MTSKEKSVISLHTINVKNVGKNIDAVVTCKIFMKKTMNI